MKISVTLVFRFFQIQNPDDNNYLLSCTRVKPKPHGKFHPNPFATFLITLVEIKQNYTGDNITSNFLGGSNDKISTKGFPELSSLHAKLPAGCTFIIQTWSEYWLPSSDSLQENQKLFQKVIIKKIWMLLLVSARQGNTDPGFCITAAHAKNV